MQSKSYTIEELRQLISPIALKYGVERVYLFGSFARGDNTARSDVDIRIDKGKLRGMFALSGFYSEVSEALGMEVDVLTTGSLEAEFLAKIQKDEVLLYAS